ncbi:MAG TPA: hypothetical protein VK508_14640 [Cyclobacteriaceae bacterium]|nr:hypothetical protein [Cyclobacteriaceae bacterium]
MKRSILLCLTLFIAAGAWAQTTRIVNNNPGATGGVNVYTGATALQTAINASVSGDIIHIVPGTVSNGNVTIDKTLTILGVGLNPQKGLGTRSLAGDIQLSGVASSGLRISGVHFGRFLPNIGCSGGISMSNILIENCQFYAVQMLNNSCAIANLIVRNCVINSHQGFSSGPQAFEIWINSGVLITNNIIRAQGSTASTILGNGLTIQNNLFFGPGTNNTFIDLDNSIVQNNIFARTSPALTATSTGNTFYNNIVFGSTDNTFTNGVAGNSATGSIIGDPLLTNVPSTSSDWVYTYDFTLLSGSPAINAGLDGTNIGPTGGITPFDPEGTLLPLIESINMPAVVTKGVNLQVNVKAKGN